MEVKTAVEGIDKVEVKGKIVEREVEGAIRMQGEPPVKEKVLVTTVKFEYDGNPGQFDRFG